MRMKNHWKRRRPKMKFNANTIAAGIYDTDGNLVLAFKNCAKRRFNMERKAFRLSTLEITAKII